MTRYTVLAINRTLPSLVVSGGRIDRHTRVKIIALRNRCSAIEKEVFMYRDQTIDQCDGDRSLLDEVMDRYLVQEVELSFEKLSEEQFETMVECSTLVLSQYELLQENIVEQP